jgi:hypothetical protein
VPTGIFISYRRDDSSGFAGRLYDRLVAQYGPDRVFMDIDTIRPGHDFAEDIERALSESLACIVLIGRQWESITDAEGRRRLEDPTDFVRLEVAAAIRRGVIVIPVLVQGASPPSSASLPEELRPLARRQAIELSNERWHYDVSRLVLALDEVVEPPVEAPSEEEAPATERSPEEAPAAEASSQVAQQEGGPPEEGAPAEPPAASEPRKGIGRVPAIAAVVVAVLVLGGLGAWLASRGSANDTTDPTGGPDASVATGTPSVTDGSGGCPDEIPTLPPSSGSDLSGTYDVTVDLQCMEGERGEDENGFNELWGEENPTVGTSGKGWDTMNWEFAPNELGASLTVGPRQIRGAQLTRTDDEGYEGNVAGNPLPDTCTAPPPQSTQRDISLSVPGDGSAFEGWLVITWTCEGHFEARFAVSGTRTG